jgi:hypothetical protein
MGVVAAAEIVERSEREGVVEPLDPDVVRRRVDPALEGPP